jgi:hypothetical protein
VACRLPGAADFDGGALIDGSGAEKRRAGKKNFFFKIFPLFVEQSKKILYLRIE